MKKLLQKIKWTDVRLVLLLGVLVFLYAFSNKRSETRSITEIDVNFKGEETHFVRETDIDEALKKCVPDLSVLNKSMLDLYKMEGFIQKNELIKKSEVYLSIDGKIKVNVWQKKAIGRVVSDLDSYYIDDSGDIMPLSDNFASRIPVIQGIVRKSQISAFKELLEKINEDSFLKEDIAEIVVESDGSIVLISRLNAYKILFGGLNEVEKKLNNYKTFVQYSIDDNVEVEEYKTINLRFTQQVVCTK